MKQVIAALALVAAAAPALAQSNSVDLHYEVERTDKEELQGRGVGTALLKVRNSTGTALVVNAQCSFLDGNLRPLSAGFGRIPAMAPRSQAHVMVQADMSIDTLRRFNKVDCSVVGTAY